MKLNPTNSTVLLLLALVAFWVAPFSVFGQSSVRISVFGGSNLDFVFNSMSDYSGGITYTNYTLIGIEVVDDPLDANDYLTWELRFEADDANMDGNLNGTNPANAIPLSVVEVSASLSAGCAGCDFFGSPFIGLSNASQLLADGDLLGAADDIPPNLAIATDQINLSYRCGVGVANNLISLSPMPDYYSDDIFIDLIMSP